jgi:sulfur carrier protein ThiS
MVFFGHSRNTIPVRSPLSAPLDRQMTLEIEVHLFSILRVNRFATARVQVSAPARVNTIVEKLGISQAEIGAVFVNGRDGRFEQSLADGDRLTLLPCIGGG